MLHQLPLRLCWSCHRHWTKEIHRLQHVILRRHLRRLQHVILGAGKTLICSFCLALFRHTGASETSRSAKLHNYSGANVRSLQDRTNNRALRRPRNTNPCTFLTWKYAMRASETKKMQETRKSGATPVGLGCAMRIVLLRKRVFTPDNKALSRSALFNSAGSINSKPKTRFRSVF